MTSIMNTIRLVASAAAAIAEVRKYEDEVVKPVKRKKPSKHKKTSRKPHSHR